jgi:hypothetical protein
MVTRIDDIWSALQHLPDHLGLDALGLKMRAGAAGGDDAEPCVSQPTGGFDDEGLVGFLDRNEDAAGGGQHRSAAELALGEGNVEITVEANHLSGRAHLRPKHRVDARETGKGEDGFLHAHMLEDFLLETKARKRLAGHDSTAGQVTDTAMPLKYP